MKIANYLLTLQLRWGRKQAELRCCALVGDSLKEQRAFIVGRAGESERSHPTGSALPHCPAVLVPIRME
jgi:hypothetical protein